MQVIGSLFYVFNMNYPNPRELYASLFFMQKQILGMNDASAKSPSISIITYGEIKKGFKICTLRLKISFSEWLSKAFRYLDFSEDSPFKVVLTLLKNQFVSEKVVPKRTPFRSFF